MSHLSANCHQNVKFRSRLTHPREFTLQCYLVMRANTPDASMEKEGLLVDNSWIGTAHQIVLPNVPVIRRCRSAGGGEK